MVKAADMNEQVSALIAEEYFLRERACMVHEAGLLITDNVRHGPAYTLG